MPLEAATYISDLDISNPASTDAIRQGDDHLRLIKSALKTTFPNLTGPVTKTQAQLNDPGFSMPIGFIGVWYGSSASCPSGWAVCNGQVVSRSDNAGTITTPDLRNLVVVGAGGSYAQAASVGALTASGTTDSQGAHSHTATGGAHSHTFTSDSHVLTVNEMPAHTHGNGVVDDTTGFQRFFRGTLSAASGGNTIADGNPIVTGVEGVTQSTGGGAGHTHTGTTDAATPTMATSADGAHTHSVSGVSTLQPALALWYIMKI